MGLLSWPSLLRVLKPVLAGVALAYVATALVDGPPPVNFQSGTRQTAKQTEIVEPHAELVMEKNIMKLGSLLSAKAVEAGGGTVDADALDLFFGPASEVEPRPSFKGEVQVTPDS